MVILLIRLYVGCCGFPVARRKYFAHLPAVELQQTFYRLPRKETAEKWRKEAPPEFIYTMKAWQVITHPPSSPTWRKAGIQVDEEKKKRYGFLKPTEENFEAWKKTLEIAETIEARVIVVQTPPSFGYTEENARNIIEFFESVERNNFIIGWEPRGNWKEHPSEVKKIINRLGLVHIVDPFKWWPPVSIESPVYMRLHGIGPREVNYSYRYTERDYELLCKYIEDAAMKLSSSENGEVYIFFNNKYMWDNAREFMEYVRSSGMKCGELIAPISP